MGYIPISKELKEKARQTNLISYLKARHPRTIHYAGHPDAPEYVCWRGVEHDSITFYSRPDENGKEVFRFFRHSTGSSDDGIRYLMEYEGYSYPQAVTALATFQESHT